MSKSTNKRSNSPYDEFSRQDETYPCPRCEIKTNPRRCAKQCSKHKLWAALDVESFYLNGLGKTELTAIVRRALDRIASHGYKPMLYTNPNYLKYRFLPHAFDAYDIWLAHWGVKTPYTVPRLKIWQYGVGSCPGVKTKVDLDIGYFEQNDTTYSVGDK